jgi:hypothetical protein
MNSQNNYKEFTDRLKLLIKKNPQLITLTLSNVFTMRLIGNKTHGDLAEIAIAEFVNQYMYDFKSIHVGKDLYRAKSKEEDIKIINEITNEDFPVSLKAYGDGPLQLSTDKSSLMFKALCEFGDLTGQEQAKAVFEHQAFAAFSELNVLPLIYDETNMRCNILVYDYAKAKAEVESIERRSEGHGRKHPVFIFRDRAGGYICEVRYGDAAANALQRGLWTHTKRASKYFDSITGGWISYSSNQVLVKLFSHALVSSIAGHEQALLKIKDDIDKLRRTSSI